MYFVNLFHLYCIFSCPGWALKIHLVSSHNKVSSMGKGRKCEGGRDVIVVLLLSSSFFFFSVPHVMSSCRMKIWRLKQSVRLPFVSHHQLRETDANLGKSSRILTAMLRR